MLTTLVNLFTFFFAVFSLITLLVLPVLMVINWVRRPGALRALVQSFRPHMAVVGMPGPFVRTPPPRNKFQNGWEWRLDSLLRRAVEQRTSWGWFGARWLLYACAIYVLFLTPLLGEDFSIQLWLACALAFIVGIVILKPGFRHTLAAWTLHFGRTFPYVLRPWYWLSVYIRDRLARVKLVTVRTLFLRRVFSLEWRDGVFMPSHAIANWVTVLLALFYLPAFVGNGIEAGYAWGTYPFGTYDGIVVTQAYRNITDIHTYSVHGYKIIDGVKHEYYFELGPNIWFWQLYPEYMFGQIPQLGRCTFDTYGITLRIPQKLHMFSAGSLYALNPWIVNIHCTAPNIVPKE